MQPMARQHETLVTVRSHRAKHLARCIPLSRSSCLHRLGSRALISKPNRSLHGHRCDAAKNQCGRRAKRRKRERPFPRPPGEGSWHRHLTHASYSWQLLRRAHPCICINRGAGIIAQPSHSPSPRTEPGGPARLAFPR